MRLELRIGKQKKEILDLGEPKLEKESKEFGLSCVYGNENEAMEVIRKLCLEYDKNEERFKGIQHGLGSGTNAWFKLKGLVEIGINWEDRNNISYIPLKPYNVYV